MSTLTLELTLELPVHRALALDTAPAPAPTLQPATWLPAAVEALQAFRQLD